MEATAPENEPFRGRRLAWICASLVGLVLVAGIAASWDSLLETWYLHRLGSDDKDTRIEAATRLGELGSLRAVPELLALIGAEERETYDYIPIDGPQRSGLDFRFDEPVSSELPELCVVHGLRVNLTPLAYALYTIGEQADPLVEASNETAPVIDVVRAFWQSPKVRPGRKGY